jgi:hypothetical protein
MGIKVLRIYIENSVVGGYFDDEFKEFTQKLFEYFRKGKYIPIISSHVMAELENGAPDYIKENLETIKYIEYDVNEEMIRLAVIYGDELHIAAATVIGVDVLGTV